MDDGLILVQFRFEGENEPQIGRFTYEQYENLKSLPITAECKILLSGRPTLSKKDQDLVNRKIRSACENDKSHTTKMS